MKTLSSLSLLILSLVTVQALAYQRSVQELYYCRQSNVSSEINWANVAVAKSGPGASMSATLIIQVTEKELTEMRRDNPYAHNTVAIDGGQALLKSANLLGETYVSERNNVRLAANASTGEGEIIFNFAALKNFPARVQALGIRTIRLHLECQKDVTF
jgi:hypothetical protein